MHVAFSPVYIGESPKQWNESCPYSCLVQSIQLSDLFFQ